MITFFKSLLHPLFVTSLILGLAIAISNHLIFHHFLEIFIVVIPTVIFVLAWNAEPFSRSPSVVYIGTGFMWVGLLHAMHMLYRGETLGYDGAASRDFSLAAGYLEAFVLITAPFVGPRLRSRYLGLTGLGLPACGIVFAVLSGQIGGLDAIGHSFLASKLYSQGALILALLATALIYLGSRDIAQTDLRLPIILALGLSVAAESSILFLRHAPQQAIDFNHALKLLSYYVICMAMVRYGFQAPLLRLRHEIADREGAERELMLQRQHLDEIIWSTNIGTWEWDVQTGQTRFNERWAEILGYSLAELQPTSIQTWIGLCHPDDLARSNELLEATFSRKVDFYECEARMRHKDGQWVWVLDRGKVVEWDGDGRPLRMSGTHQDVTERVEQRLSILKHQEELELAGTVFDSAREGILITDANATILAANASVSEITGYSKDEVIGQNPRMFSSGLQGQEFYREMWEALLSRGHWEGEVWNRRKNGRFYAELLKIAVVRDDAGGIKNFVSLMSDITRQKEYQSELERIAYFDALTGLPNRVLLADRLRQAILTSKRDTGQSACIYLDLDGFKKINEQHGHEVGDSLLVKLAERMRTVLREGDSLARIGGDEFVGVVVALDGLLALEALLGRLLAAVRQPVTVDDLTLQVSASVGVAIFPQDNEVDADLLLRQADQAMYQSKLHGKNCYTIFDQENDRSIRGYHETLTRLRQALAAGEFRLFYQPKADMRTGSIIGAEALIRWQHPELGLLTPGHFLPTIEDHDLSAEIGEWVIATALQQIAEWRVSGIKIAVSVNVDLSHLGRKNFPVRLAEMLGRYPAMDARDLHLEILETSGLRDEQAVIENIEQCVALGVAFSLDDFGTGYSSMSYLRRLPVSQVKIDQSFVRDMMSDPRDLAIVDGIIALANAFEIQVIAEGVESPTTLRTLLRLGCDRIQGYFLSRPLPPGEFLAWYQSWTPDPAIVPVRISKDLTPLIYAQVNHAAWAQSLLSQIECKRLSPHDLQSSLCRFWDWLDGRGRDLLAGIPAFGDMVAHHRRLHELASSLIDSDDMETRSRYGEAQHELDRSIEALLSAISTSAEMQRKTALGSAGYSKPPSDG